MWTVSSGGSPNGMNGIWTITRAFPYLYGKEPVVVIDQDGIRHEIMAYTMNSPYKDVPAMPSKAYLEGI